MVIDHLARYESPTWQIVSLEIIHCDLCSPVIPVAYAPFHIYLRQFFGDFSIAIHLLEIRNCHLHIKHECGKSVVSPTDVTAIVRCLTVVSDGNIGR